MKKYLVLFITMFIFICNVNAEDLVDVTLVKCVDGDTAVFNMNGEETKFRFLAVDTPESVHPTKGTQFMGKEASEYTCNLLTSAKNIQVEYDEKGSKTDNYGRNLAWIYVDGELVQEKLVSEGYAEVAYIYYKYSKVEHLCEVQEKAKNNKSGIWSVDRTEGYCATKSNAKSENETTSSKTTKSTTTKKVTTTKSSNEKIIKYISSGKYEKAIELLMDDTDNIYILIFLFVLLLIVSYLGVSKKKRRKK